jgi:hypothetical protein
VTAVVGWLAILFGVGFVAGRPRSPGPVSQPPVPVVDLDTPCGVTSAAIAARLAGEAAVDLATARKAVRFDSSGRTSVSELVDGLDKLHLPACAVLLARSDLVKLSGLGPAIFLVHDSHFVAGLVAPDGGVVLVELHETARVSAEEFPAMWSGHVILLSRDRPSLAELLGRLGLAG